VILGLALRFNLPIEWARYSAMGILAALDSLLGAARSELGIDLEGVALVAFGWRIFQNVAVIRRHFL